MNIDTSIYSLDGNSIWDVSLKFERLGLQEIHKFPETVFQGQDLNNSRDSFNYKMQFDKLFSLVKEFYVKINGIENMLINEDVDDEFNKVVIKERRKQGVKTAKTNFMKKIREMLNENDFGEIVKEIESKIPRILNSNDDGPMKYAKLEMIPDALDLVFKSIENNGSDLKEVLTEYENEKNETLDETLKALEETYNEKEDELKKEIILGLKERPEAQRQADISNTLKLTRYEGSASNVLRDILLTSNTMIQDINSKRVELQESIRQDDRLLNTIKKDNSLIVQYMGELEEMDEINKNYSEPFDKASENMLKIALFVREL